MRELLTGFMICYTLRYMIHQKSNLVPILLFLGAGGIFAFSVYIFLTTENTIIVVNEVAAEPKEVFLAAPVQEQAPEPEALEQNPRIQILETGVGFLNVRSDASVSSQKVGTVKPGEVYEYTETKNNWYRIVHPTLQNAWVSGEYVKVVDRSSDLFGGG
jgi:hypothetical protein